MAATQQNQQATRPATAPWDLDPAHSEAGFSVRHMMISTVSGRFKTLRGTLHLDEAKPENSRVEAEIEVASIDTGVPDRDNHLRSADFFDAENHPTLRFVGTRVERTGADTARTAGELTIRGVTREVTLEIAREGEITDPWGSRRLGFTAETVLDRKAFGLTWNQMLEAGGVLVGDKVQVTIRAQAVERKEEAA